MTVRVTPAELLAAAAQGFRLAGATRAAATVTLADPAGELGGEVDAAAAACRVALARAEVMLAVALADAALTLRAAAAAYTAHERALAGRIGGGQEP